MNRLQALWTPVFLGGLLYALYAAFTDAWPMGWINLAQQWVFGAYSVKISMLVLMLGMALGLATIWSFFERSPSAQTGAASTAPPTAPHAPTRTLLWTGAALLATIWASGLGAAWWYGHEAQADLHAHYRPLRLEAGATPAAATGEHLAVHGVVLLSHAVVHRVGGNDASGREAHWLIPVVSTAWRPGAEALLVIKVKHPSELPGHPSSGRSWLLPEPVLVRVGGPVAVPAAHAFANAGVPLAPDHHQLQWIPSRQGVPVPEDIDALRFALWACSAISLLTVFFLAVMAWAQRRQRLLAGGGGARRHPA